MSVEESHFTVCVMVTGESEMANYVQYRAWVDTVRAAVGAEIAMNDGKPWAVGDMHGRWREDHYGRRYFDKTPYAYVWQQGITGDVVSVAMAYVWAAIHLVQPLEEAGFNIDHVWAGRSAEMVLLG